MSRKNFAIVVPAVLLLAACSRNNPPAVAQNANPEPVDRTAAAANAPQASSPAQFAQSQPPAGMYASGQPVAQNPYSAPPPAPPANSAYEPPPMDNSADRGAYAGTPPQPPAAPQPQYAPEPAYPPEPPAGEPPAAVAPATPARSSWDEPVLPAGTVLRVRLDETLGTKHDRTGTHFYATLSAPITESGRVLLPAGTRFVGHLTESKPSGRLKGRAILAVRLDAFQWRGREVAIDSSSIVRETRGRKRHDLAWIGGGSGFGAVLGAVAGGGGGALIGAAAGAGAGTAGALVTPKKQLYMPAETALVFRLRRPVQL